MHPALRTRHRFVVHATLAFTKADNALRLAQRETRALMPDITSAKVRLIGHPGSRMRRLYDDRNRALERMQVAYLKLDRARSRLNTQNADLFA
ncbi:hypothetical protein [Shimia abyssi]|uniref:Uncharacterized protein n=1 Tax=Shimia abyssi TaxID=1662395 RepID=A0A2P8FB17_9RHOB|nr:hypothetical protein [Shimia abyssi]PSL18927.1 hypothetical protein CLV88_108106 [Shimia abyssi]